MAAPPAHIAVLFPLVIAVAMILCTIFIHARGLVAIMEFVRRERRLGRAGAKFWRDVTIVGGAALLALTAHLVEITAWAVLFVLAEEFPHIATAFYHSAVNYTSLGYGDVVMSASWRLLA